MEIELFDIFDQPRMQAAMAIRRLVFVTEQGVPEAEEIDMHDVADSEAIHALARPRAGANALGTGRLFARERTTVQIGRLAVLPEARGTGVGRALLEALIDEARRRGCVWAQLDAQVQAVAFYQRAGFLAAGEPLWEAGILHQPMRRRLAP